MVSGSWPVLGTLAEVQTGVYSYHVCTDVEMQRVREPTQFQPLERSSGCRIALGITRQFVASRGHRAQEFRPKASPLHFIPREGLLNFLSRGGLEFDAARHKRTPKLSAICSRLLP